MTTGFFPNKKRLHTRYNKRIWKAALPAIFTLLTLFFAVLVNSGSLQTPAYYSAIFSILSVVVGYGFVMLWMGSFLIERRLNNNLLHTYVQISGDILIISCYLRSTCGENPVAYKKLYLIRLGEIEDVYCYHRNVIVIAPTRLLIERADWLTLSTAESERDVGFDNWWYEKNGGSEVNGVEIKDMFSYPKRIEKTILLAAGKVQKKNAQRRKFREQMLNIAKKVR